MVTYHIPVLLRESVEMLNIRDEGVYVDTTFGGGGYSRAMLEANPTITLLAFDRDKDAIEKNSKMFEKFGNRFSIINDNFSNLRTHIALKKIKYIDGIVFDLGISNYQIATGERGLSFDLNGDLDMRMNQDDELTAYEVVNTYSVEELTQIFREYGEEREAYRIAKGVDSARQKGEIKTTRELADIIDLNTRSSQKIKAKARIFQSLRIYINKELESLKEGLAAAVESLNSKGRVVAISYHSLEDRIVKQYFNLETKECVCPPKFPKCVCDKTARLRLINKKPILPTEEECALNRQARSAKMRVAERI
ncbi:MAG: 16S rRNA (cytosine(1402)-N(4))-methyltransferase RsmH [Candidatus Cloacimonas sp.]|nr:16S rRNA (cytosine(1402)-N(4))-methyltransferase RsmH [Candidatus Cloacimonadota bacterium]